MSSQQQHKMWVLTMALSVAVMALFVVVAKQSRLLDAITQGPRGMFVQKMMPGEARPFAMDRVFAKDDYDLYTDPSGRFAFLHPKDVVVTVSTSTITTAQGKLPVTITSLTNADPAKARTTMDPNGEPLADVNIVVSSGGVEFSRYPGWDVPYFADLVSSFRLLEAATSTPRS